MKTSSKTGEGVEEAFEGVTRVVVERREKRKGQGQGAEEREAGARLTVGARLERAESKVKKMCCGG